MEASRTSSWVGIGIVVLLVALAFALQGGGREGSGIPGSVDSTQPKGRRALALLLGRVGIQAEGWRQVPAALPRGENAVWIADGRRGDEPGESERVRGLSQVGMHAPEHYTAFAEDGGTLVVEGIHGLAFLRDVLEVEDIDDLEITSREGAGARAVRLPGGETVHVDARLAFEPLDSDGVASELAVFDDRLGGKARALAVEVPIGIGRAIVIADSSLFENENVGGDDNALFTVRIAEEAAGGGRVLLDEYALGLWEPSGALAVAVRPALALFTANALLLLLLWTWMRAAPRAFPRDPESLETFSPVLRARSRARLLERSGHVALLAPAARGAAFDRISARRHITRRAGGKRREIGADLAQAGPSEADVLRLATALGPELGSRATELLRTRRIAQRSDLEKLARDIARLEVDALERAAAVAGP
jgi:hypothetical protein